MRTPIAFIAVVALANAAIAAAAPEGAEPPTEAHFVPMDELSVPIVDGARKAAELERMREGAGLPAVDVLAVGDGANDVRMIAAAGLGVSFRGKPVLDAAADASIRFNDLSALLWAQGYPRDAWTTG